MLLFVPKEKTKLYQKIIQKFQKTEEEGSLLKYFEENYLEGKYKKIMGQEFDEQNTNNVVEAFNSRLSVFTHRRPTLGQLG